MKHSMSASPIWKQSGGVCHYCAVHVTIETATRDHIKPTRGEGRGVDGHSNLVIACMPCNSRKGDGDYAVFVESDWLRDRRNAVQLGIVKTAEPRDSRRHEWTIVPEVWVATSGPSPKKKLRTKTPAKPASSPQPKIKGITPSKWIPVQRMTPDGAAYTVLVKASK